MGISLSYPTISPTQAKTANFRNSGTTQNTWYTLVDVASGTGILNKVVMATNITNNNHEIRVTIDGVANILTAGTNNYARGLVHNMTSGDMNYNGYYAFYYNAPIYFYASLKVEVRQTYGTYTIESNCDYSIV